jgi:hypothetical protein
MDDRLIDAILESIQAACDPLLERIQALEATVAALTAAPTPPSATVDAQTIAAAVRAHLQR